MQSPERVSCVNLGQSPIPKSNKMKNIVICCDGTSNDFGDRNSNVVKLFSVLKKEHGEQIVYYDPGVGTPSTYDSFNPITKKLKYIFGQSFGYGLSENIMEAYQFLMKNYEEGDKVFLFGFSRGAYTVRAIAGLIDTCGLLHDHSENLIPEAMRIYFDRTKKKIADDFKKIFSRSCPIHFLGLWDTVSSVGWVYNPVTLQATANNPSVKNVRHAIAIDERRAFFRQNLWGSKHKDQQDVKQVWFAGVHSDVGGSYPLEDSALSNITLEWMTVEARGKGIIVEDLDLARSIVQQIKEPQTKDQNKSLAGGWYIAEIWPKIVRVKKKRANGEMKWVSRPYLNFGRPRLMWKNQTLHESVLQRMQARPDYRPKNVLKICHNINEVGNHFSVEKWNRL